jgi:hypothetical protein
VRPHLRTVGLCLDQPKGFRYQHSRPSSRLLLLSSWKTGLFCCADARLPGETKSQTMSNMPTTAWRAAVLWYGWRAAPLYHTALRDGFPGVTDLLLNRTAGSSLVPAQPIGYLNLANFDAAPSHRHGGLSWLRRRPAMTIPFGRVSFANGRRLNRENITESSRNIFQSVCCVMFVGTAAAARTRTLPLNDRANPDGVARMDVTATNTDHSHTALSGSPNLSTNMALCYAVCPAWVCDGYRPASREQGGGSYDRSSPSTIPVGL